LRANSRSRSCLVAALAAVILSGGCAAGDDVIRAASRYADELARAKTVGDDIARTLASVDEAAVVRSAQRVDSIGTRFQVSPEIRSAFQMLIWDVGCDVAGGSVEPTVASVARLLAVRAASFGLEFTDDGVQAVGGAVLDAFGREIGFVRSDAAEACSRIPNSGP
jgi:hypothetical protein